MTEAIHRLPSTNRIEPIGARIAASHRVAPVMVTALLVWELIMLSAAAGRTFFWYDELLTLHVSGLEPFSQVWQALHAGADGMPPGYYAMIRAARMLPFDPMVSLRLPSIVGYLLTQLGVFLFTRKRLTSTAAMAAVLLVALSPFRGYALEARSYALLTGLLTLAAVFWQRIGTQRMATPLFGLCLFLAVACHHLAVVTIAIFGGAELVWALWNRRLRQSVWVACLCAIIPFLAGLPIALQFRTIFGRHFWSLPQWKTALDTYRAYLGEDLNPALVLCLVILLAGLAALPGVLKRHRAGQPERTFPLPELVLVAGFLLYPAVLVVLARLMGSGYVPRYGLPVVFGLAVGVAYLLRAIWTHGHAVVLPGALFLLFAARGVLEVGWVRQSPPPPPDQNWARLIEASRGQSQIPIVVSPGALFLEAVQYAPRQLHRQLVYVVDPTEAVNLTGTDTPDRSNQVLSRFVPLRVEDRAAFLAAHPRFLLSSTADPLDWFTPYLTRSGHRLQLLFRRGGHSIYLAGD